MKKNLVVAALLAAGITTGSSAAGAEPITYHLEECISVPSTDFDTICVVYDEVQVREGAVINSRITAVFSYYLGGVLVNTITDDRHAVSLSQSGGTVQQGVTVARTGDGCGFVDMYVDNAGNRVMNFTSHCPT